MATTASTTCSRRLAAAPPPRWACPNPNLHHAFRPWSSSALRVVGRAHSSVLLQKARLVASTMSCCSPLRREGGWKIGWSVALWRWADEVAERQVERAWVLMETCTIHVNSSGRILILWSLHAPSRTTASSWTARDASIAAIEFVGC